MRNKSDHATTESYTDLKVYLSGCPPRGSTFNKLVYRLLLFEKKMAMEWFPNTFSSRFLVRQSKKCIHWENQAPCLLYGKHSIYMMILNRWMSIMHNLGTRWAHISPVKFFAKVVQVLKFHLEKPVYHNKLQAYLLSAHEEENWPILFKGINNGGVHILSLWIVDKSNISTHAVNDEFQFHYIPWVLYEDIWNTVLCIGLEGPLDTQATKLQPSPAIQM